MNYDFIQIGEDSLLGNNYAPGKQSAAGSVLKIGDLMRLRRAQVLFGLRQSLEGFQCADMGNFQLLGSIGQKGIKLGRRYGHGGSTNAQKRVELRDVSLSATHEGRRGNRYWHQPCVLASEKNAVEIRIRFGDDCYSSASVESQAQQLSRQGYCLLSKIRIRKNGRQLASAPVEIATRLSQGCVIQSLAEGRKISSSKNYGVFSWGGFQLSPVFTTSAQATSIGSTPKRGTLVNPHRKRENFIETSRFGSNSSCLRAGYDHHRSLPISW